MTEMYSNALDVLRRPCAKHSAQLRSLVLRGNGAELIHSLWANRQLNWAFGGIRFWARCTKLSVQPALAVKYHC